MCSTPHTEQRSRYCKRPVEARGVSNRTRNFLCKFLLFLRQPSSLSVSLHRQNDEKWGKEETGEGLGEDCSGVDRGVTYCSGTGGQRAVGQVRVGEVRDHEERVARVVGTLEKATILLPSQRCVDEGGGGGEKKGLARDTPELKFLLNFFFVHFCSLRHPRLPSLK